MMFSLKYRRQGIAFNNLVVLSGIFVPKTKEVVGVWKNCTKLELRNIAVMKPIRVRWAGHVARTEEM
jgi:hypothetical protein